MHKNGSQVVNLVYAYEINDRKAARKMLVKLTPGVDLAELLQQYF
jgi:hypothetical protein